MVLGQEGVSTRGGLTPFSWATKSGHEAVVKMLLERDDVNPNTTDSYGKTPLSIAARKGHERVVKMLLERVDINPNTVTNHGDTPLFIAADEGMKGS